MLANSLYIYFKALNNKVHVNKKSSAEIWNSYKKQRNFCLKLLRQAKENYIHNLNVNKVTDNKTFSKSVKPFSSNKGLNLNNILLMEENEIGTDEGKLATIMYRYFTDTTKHMKPKPKKISH